MPSAFNLFAWALLLFVGGSLASIGCIDDNGKAVDWWVIIKLPTVTGSPNANASAGYAYIYGDVNSQTLAWSHHSFFDSTSGALSNTLAQVYANAASSTVGWVMYDDELADTTHSSFAHSKGVIGFDSTQGFWLVHSVPRFPDSPPPATYAYPDDETDNAQSFLCVTYGITTMNVVSSLFVINKPYVFASNVPTIFTTLLPALHLVLAGTWNTTATAITTKLTSVGGHAFQAFAKNSQWNNDLYEGIVQPTIKLDMNIQTWREGASSILMPSYCTPTYAYNSMNVLTMHAFDLSNRNISWSYTKDHSKWGISTTDSTTTTSWVCIGDINRMTSQASRGGGTVCFSNKGMWTAFNSLITSISPCSLTSAGSKYETLGGDDKTASAAILLPGILACICALVTLFAL